MLFYIPRYRNRLHNNIQKPVQSRKTAVAVRYLPAYGRLAGNTVGIPRHAGGNVRRGGIAATYNSYRSETRRAS